METPGRLASGRRVTIFGLEVCLLWIGNDPRMRLFGLQVHMALGCPSAGIFPVASAVLEEQLTRPCSLQTPVASLGPPRVLSFTRGSHRMFRKQLYPWLWFITVEEYQLKSAEGRSTKGRVQKSSQCGDSSCPLAMESRAAMGTYVPGALPTGEAHGALVSIVFMGAPSRGHCWLITWLISVPSASWG